MPLPKNKDDLRSWIGMITFFFRYAPNLSTLLQPLHSSVQSREWRWGKEQQDAYDRTLAALATQILLSYSLERPLRLTTVAGPMGLGCVLAHVTVDGREEPIAFGSKTLSQAERNYPVHEKEAAEVIFGLKKFFKILYGRDFEIITDNAAIAALFGEKSHVRALAAARLQRWALMLGAFRYKIRRRKSEKIPLADYLSRHPVADDTPVETEIYQVNFVEDNIMVSALDLLAETDSDPVLQKVRYFVLNGWPDQVEAELQTYEKRYLQLTVEGGCLLGTRVIVPTTIRSAVLQLLPETYPGVSRMTSLARAHVWFPRLDKDIEQLVRDCAFCRALRPDIPHEQLVPWSWPTRRYQRIFRDFGSFRGVDMLLCIDGHAKWPEVQQMPDLTANSTIEVLRSWYSRYGMPEEVVCDNGPPFTSKAFREFVETQGGVLTHSPTYHPQSNGQVERGVRSLKDGLGKMLLDPKTASRSLQHNDESWLFAYRYTPHSVTKVSPAEVFLGRSPRTNLSLLQPEQLLKKSMHEARLRTQAAHPGKTSAHVPGSLVWVRNTIHRAVKRQPGVIVSVVSSVSYEVAVQGLVRQVSSTHLRRRSPSASSIEAHPLARTGRGFDAEVRPTDHAVVPHAVAVELPPPPLCAPVPIPLLATPPTPPTEVPMTPRPAPARPPSSPCPTAGPTTPRTPKAATTSSLDASGPTSPAQTATPEDTSRATPGLDPATGAGGGNRPTTAPPPGAPRRTKSGRLIVKPKRFT